MRSWGLMVVTYMPCVLAASNTVGSFMLGHNLVPRVSLLPVPWPRGLSSLPPLVVGTETLVAAGHVTTQNLGGRKICWKGGATGFFIVTVTNLLR